MLNQILEGAELTTFLFPNVCRKPGDQVKDQICRPDEQPRFIALRPWLQSNRHPRP
jgi:hypothetical protein